MVFRRVCWRAGASQTPSGQQLKAALQPGKQSLGWEHLDASGGKLYCQRQAIKSYADLGYRRGVLVSNLKVRFGCLGPLYEERHRIVLGKLLQVGQLARRGPDIRAGKEWARYIRARLLS